MTDNDDVTHWLEQLAAGDEKAAGKIYHKYWDDLVHMARKRLADGSRRVADEEDVALSAFASFCKGIAAGRFPQLDDREDLWKLLMTITARKAIAQIRRQQRQKRGSGEVRGESVFLQADPLKSNAGIESVPAPAADPQVLAIMSEQCEELLRELDDEALRQIALLKMEGYANEEIARKLDCSVRTVKRRLAMIRSRWVEKAGIL